MKACVEEYRDFTVNEIAQKYIKGEPQIAQAAVHSVLRNSPSDG